MIRSKVPKLQNWTLTSVHAHLFVRIVLVHSNLSCTFDFKLESDMVEDRLRHHFDYYLGKTEIVSYSVLAVLLAVTAFVTIATAGQILWIGLSRWTVAAQTLRVLNQLLIVLMLGSKPTWNGCASRS
jgi:hypothetical protein